MAIPKYDLLLPIFCDQVASIYIGMWAYEIFWIKHCKNRSNSPNSENFVFYFKECISKSDNTCYISSMSELHVSVRNFFWYLASVASMSPSPSLANNLLSCKHTA